MIKTFTHFKKVIYFLINGNNTCFTLTYINKIKIFVRILYLMMGYEFNYELRLSKCRL
jgi:hypothetical protein